MNVIGDNEKIIGSISDFGSLRHGDLVRLPLRAGSTTPYAFGVFQHISLRVVEMRFDGQVINVIDARGFPMEQLRQISGFREHKDTMSQAPHCPYCSRPAQFINSRAVYGRDYGMLWACRECDAYVGVHEGTNKPLGTLADKPLREARKAAHAAFDPLWQSGDMKRGDAYTMLKRWMGYSESRDAHIGMMDLEQCRLLMHRLEDHRQMRRSPHEPGVGSELRRAALARRRKASTTSAITQRSLELTRQRSELKTARDKMQITIAEFNASMVRLSDQRRLLRGKSPEGVA